MADIDPKVSQYMSNLAKKNLNNPMRDPAYAREMARRSALARKRKKQAKDEQATS